MYRSILVTHNMYVLICRGARTYVQSVPEQGDLEDAARPGEGQKDSCFIRRVIEKVWTVSGWDLQ